MFESAPGRAVWMSVAPPSVEPWLIVPTCRSHFPHGSMMIQSTAETFCASVLFCPLFPFLDFINYYRVLKGSDITANGVWHKKFSDKHRFLLKFLKFVLIFSKASGMHNSMNNNILSLIITQVLTKKNLTHNLSLWQQSLYVWNDQEVLITLQHKEEHYAPSGSQQQKDDWREQTPPFMPLCYVEQVLHCGHKLLTVSHNLNFVEVNIAYYDIETNESCMASEAIRQHQPYDSEALVNMPMGSDLLLAMQSTH